MQEVVDGQHEQQHATGDQEISDRHPEEVQCGVADEQEG
jgi:hypothetical protein